MDLCTAWCCLGGDGYLVVEVRYSVVAGHDVYTGFETCLYLLRQCFVQTEAIMKTKTRVYVL